jgi:alpha-glucosidase
MADAGHTEWWRNSAVYQIYLRSFSDGNGDGVGDMAGLREQLPYLADLGVDAVWISPWYLSPMVDGGYDVADYRQIDPLFGTLHEAEMLIKEAHALQLRLIIDVIPNHTSDQHVWFAAALASEPGSEARDRYIFRPGRGREGSLPPNDWQAAFGGSAWRRVVSPGGRVEWCLHLFAPEQPDLNWRNPEVRAEFVSILRFWLDRGVDGVRVDVANCIVKPEELNELEAQPNFTTGIINNSLVMGDHPDVHAVYREWRSVLDSYPGDRMAVGEIWVPDPDRLAKYLRPDEFNLVFNFGFLKAPWSAGEMRDIIEHTLAANADVGAPTTWVLANHDVQRIATRYGGGDIGRRRALAAFLLVAALPGALYIYEGDELGLEEVTDLPDSVLRDPVWARSGFTDRGRDGCRVPLPWTVDGPSFGFSAGAGWLPQPTDWNHKSIEAQLADPNSFLNLYRRALTLRRLLPELQEEDVTWLESDPNVLAFSRGGSGKVVCAVNLGSESAAVPGIAGSPLLASSPTQTDDGRLAAYTAAWWRISDK